MKAHPSLENLAFLEDEKVNLSISEKSLPDLMLKFGIQNYPSNGQGGFDRYAMTQKTIGITQIYLACLNFLNNRAVNQEPFT
jgi:hypothetical protein